MLKHLYDLLCLRSKTRKLVLGYCKVERYYSIKSFNYENFALYETVEYSIVKVIPKYLVSIFNVFNLYCISKVSCIEISIY